ncbi:hypothetical protein ACX9I7_07750 [Streptomyces sp. L500]|uniref:hypothetical protein n=1 Tax=Streptomyces abikoensis TaxID=97398 RepID=UPI0033F3734B
MLFLDRFREMVDRSELRHPVTPQRALETWAEFVEDCGEGYGSTLYEYWDDISIRRFLQAVIADPVIRSTPEAEWFAAEVGRIDDSFREVLEGGFAVSGGWGWWEQRIPAFCGEEMAFNVREHYGFEIEVR